MELKNFLKKLFPDREDAKYSSYIEDLKNMGIDFVSDLKYVNDKTREILKSFTDIEISKLIEAYSVFSKFSTILRFQLVTKH